MSAACLFGLYAVGIAGLMLAGRQDIVRELALFPPDCLVLVKRLLADPRVPRRHKAMLGGLVAYLALPLDLVPDFLPIVGQLDDVIVIALVLRAVLRASGRELLAEHWRGTARSLDVVARLAGLPATATATEPG